jgi:hypothetical protein
MKALYRIAAILLTLLSAGVIAILISVATDDNREIRVVNFTLFAIGAIAALIAAVVLWRRAATK